MEGSMFTRGRVAVLVAEFLGTAVLALTILAVFSSQINIGYFVAIGAGLAFFVLTLAFGGISGAVLNPAISLGLWTVRRLSTLRTFGYIVAQMLGALAAFALYEYLREADGAWGNQTSGFDPQVLVAEIAGTTIFAFGVAAALYQKLTGIVKAAVVGVSLTVGIIVAGLASFGLLNPAVAFSAQTWELSTYVLGPVLGAIIGLNLYNLVFRAHNAPATVRTSGGAQTVKSSPKATVTSKSSGKKSSVKTPAKKKTAAKK